MTSSDDGSEPGPRTGYRPAATRIGSAAVAGGRLSGQPVELDEFGVELADLVLPPDRRAEMVMGDRRQHQEAGLGGVQAVIQPIGVFHAGVPASCAGCGGWPD